MSRFESRNLLNASIGQPCVLCGRSGSTVPAHLPGSFYGMEAGVAQKTHDWLVADLCNAPWPDGRPSCHEMMDTVWRRDALMRMMALCRTLERRFESGALVVARDLATGRSRV